MEIPHPPHCPRPPPPLLQCSPHPCPHLRLLLLLLLPSSSSLPGECEVAEEDLDDFLRTGRDLKMKGLLDPLVKEDDKPIQDFSSENTQPQAEQEQNTVPSEQNMAFSFNQEEDVKQNFFTTTSANPTKTTVKSENHVANFNLQGDGKYQCNQCSYKAPKQGQVAIHIQAKHEGARYSCDKCDYKSTHQNHMTMHKRRKHV